MESALGAVPTPEQAPSASAIRRAVAAVPRPLAALLGVVLIFGLAWALILPPWQAPDENVHFAYAQSLAERFALPGDTHRSSVSTDQTLADNAVGASRMAFNPDSVKPDWNAADYQRYLALTGGNPSRADGGGPSNVAVNPPLYYVYADLAYWAAYGGNAFDRLYAIQIWGIALLMATVIGAWLLAGEVFGRGRLLQLVCAAVAALVPMETFISTSVTPDGLLVALWTLALWLGARVIVRAAPRRDAVALCAVTAAAILTKATAYALFPPVLLALLIGGLRHPKEERRAMLRPLGLALLVLILPVIAWVTLATALGRSAVNAITPPRGAHPKPFRVRQFISYLWQFYLPRLPFLTPFGEAPQLPLYFYWIREGWGIFGWTGIALPDWAYHFLAGVSALIIVPALAVLARFRDRLRLALVGYLALALVSLLALLHLSDYRSIISGNDPLVQGRYLLPLVALFGLAVALLVSRLPARWRAPASAIVLAGMLLLQVLALGAVITTSYT